MTSLIQRPPRGTVSRRHWYVVAGAAVGVVVFVGTAVLIPAGSAAGFVKLPALLLALVCAATVPAAVRSPGRARYVLASKEVRPPDFVELVRITVETAEDQLVTRGVAVVRVDAAGLDVLWPGSRASSRVPRSRVAGIELVDTGSGWAVGLQLRAGETPRELILLDPTVYRSTFSAPRLRAETLREGIRRRWGAQAPAPAEPAAPPEA